MKVSPIINSKYNNRMHFSGEIRQGASACNKTTAALINSKIKDLDGIQKGISLFNEMSLSEIFYFANHVLEIVLQRGCQNMCTHCYADAMPPNYKASRNKINKIAFEDFESFCDSFNELNKRLGFNIFDNSEIPYITLFHDSDSSMIFLQDKKGIQYDYADLSKKLFDLTGKRVLFDTSGWNLTDKETQQRMQALVNKIINTNKYDFIYFNVSLNPFHSIYNKSLNLVKEGRTNEANYLRNIYTERMANVLYTLSPLTQKTNSILQTPMLKFIIRCLPDDIENSNGMTTKDFKSLFGEIMLKLENLYEKDINNQNKTITHEQTDRYIDFYKNLIQNSIKTSPSVNGRLANLLAGNKGGKELYSLTRDNIRNDAGYGADYFGILDINGKYYTTNFYESYPTELKFNYLNKTKDTAPIQPNLQNEIVTKQMISSVVSKTQQ